MAQDEWFKLEEAATYLRLTKSSMYRLTSEGKLRFYKLAGVGGRRFKRSDLDALLEPGQGTPGKEWAA